MEILAGVNVWYLCGAFWILLAALLVYLVGQTYKKD